MTGDRGGYLGYGMHMLIIYGYPVIIDIQIDY